MLNHSQIGRWKNLSSDPSQEVATHRSIRFDRGSKFTGGTKVSSTIAHISHARRGKCSQNFFQNTALHVVGWNTGPQQSWQCMTWKTVKESTGSLMDINGPYDFMWFIDRKNICENIKHCSLWCHCIRIPISFRNCSTSRANNTVQSVK